MMLLLYLAARLYFTELHSVVQNRSIVKARKLFVQRYCYILHHHAVLWSAESSRALEWKTLEWKAQEWKALELKTLEWKALE